MYYFCLAMWLSRDLHNLRFVCIDYELYTHKLWYKYTHIFTIMKVRSSLFTTFYYRLSYVEYTFANFFHKRLNTVVICRYERLLRRARTEDLSEVSGIGCLYQSGVDRFGRPVVVFVGKWFRFKEINLDKVCRYKYMFVKAFRLI